MNLSSSETQEAPIYITDMNPSPVLYRHEKFVLN